MESMAVTSWGILGEFYFGPYPNFAPHVLLPHLILIGAAAWLVMAAARPKSDVVAYASAIVVLVGGFYWALLWGAGGTALATPPRVVLQGIPFVSVPAGRTLVGSPKTEYGRWEGVEDQHEAILGQDLWFSQTELTQRQFNRVLGDGQNLSRQKDPDSPVTNMTLKIARRLCEELGSGEPAWQFRLPTQDEWEYACRASVHGPICTGTRGNPSEARDLDRLNRDLSKTAVYGTTGPAKVATKLPNRWGLYDMQGNVAEMCCDRADEWSMTKVPVRGGSWAAGYESTRCASRASIGSDEKKGSIGLRLVAVPIRRAFGAVGHDDLYGGADPPAKPRWADYVDWTCRILGSLLLLPILIRIWVRPSEDTFVAIDASETAVSRGAGARLLLLWVVIWTVAFVGIMVYPYLGARLRIPLLGQTSLVQRQVLSALSMLLAMLMSLVTMRVAYPSSSYGSVRVSSKSHAIAYGIGAAILLYLTLRPLVDVLTWANHWFVSRYLPAFRPSLVGGLSILGDLMGPRSGASLSEPTGLRRFGLPLVVCAVQCVGILFEESFFRGLLQGYFRLVGGRWGAILLPNLIYAATILSTMPDQVAPMLLIGLAAGYAREWRYYQDRAGASLFCPIILRLLLSARGFVWMYLGVPYASI